MSITPPMRTWGHDEPVAIRLHADGTRARIMCRPAAGVRGALEDSYQLITDQGKILATTADPAAIARAMLAAGYARREPLAASHPPPPDWVDRWAGGEEQIMTPEQRAMEVRAEISARLAAGERDVPTVWARRDSETEADWRARVAAEKRMRGWSPDASPHG
jgi:hypothetical protein